MADKDPREKLDEMYRMLKEMDRSPLLSDIRNPPKPIQMRGKILHVLHEDGGSTAEEIAEKLNRIDDDEYIARQVSGTLSDLYTQYFVDRDDEQKSKHYLSPIGVQVVRDWDIDRSLSDFTVGDEEQEDEPDPWDDTELTPGQYKALVAIDTAGDERCTQNEANDTFLSEFDYTDTGGNSAIVPRVSRLKDKGYINCAPGEPKLLWVTDEGDELLNA